MYAAINTNKNQEQQQQQQNPRIYFELVKRENLL